MLPIKAKVEIEETKVLLILLHKFAAFWYSTFCQNR